MANLYRIYALSTVALFGLCPIAVAAQVSAATGPAADEAEQGIVVTGSRIKQDGYDAPVPVNVLGSADIQAQKPANIADLVLTLPSAAGGATSATSTTNQSGGLFGISTIDLRGLGQARTLVLLNGHRTVGSSFSGLIDVNTFPQDLIERVEVVTGGASAQYGSDAVGGVVNFILNDKFKGFKFGADTGISTYGDGPSYRFVASAGFSMLDDRLHVLLNGEYFKQEEVATVDRSWNRNGYQRIRNPAYVPGNGQAEFYVGPQTGIATRSAGGLIYSATRANGTTTTAGPLIGTYFLGDGVTRQLNYGAFNATSNPFMIGGDWQITEDVEVGTNSLIPEEERIGTFSRVAFDVTPDVTVYGQFSWNRYEGLSSAGTIARQAAIRADNAYLLTQYPTVAAAMAANGLTSINIGTLSQPRLITDNSREIFRYIAGANGRFSLSGKPWTWELYYQHGVTKTHESLRNIPNTAREALARDAVLSNGQIVCRSTLLDPTNGCVPLDSLGTPEPLGAALAYIFGPEQPYRDQTIKQDVASFVLSGEVFDLPGGTASVALGGEWRKDKVSGVVGAFSSSGWTHGNYRPNFGQQSVKEGFLEVALPVFEGFSLDLAGRITDYSVSGSVETWKVGGTYSPIPDVKFRAAYSHDIRAPNLQDLFATVSAGRTVVNLPANSPQPGLVETQTETRGNLDLDPETANTLTAGVVLTPGSLPGFSASFDYYDIKLKGAIGSVGGQSSVDFCYAGFSQFCSNLVFTANQLTRILNQPVNFQSQRVKGYDIEASYRTSLSAISERLPGTFSIHAAVTHNIKNVVDNLVFPVDRAGVINDGTNGSAPSWVYRISAFVDVDPVSLNLVTRGFSSGVYSNEFIECTSSCPASTVQNRTINDNHIDGAIYFDGSLSFKIPSLRGETRLTFIVNNILNRDPAPYGQDVNGDYNTVLQAARRYDTVGRRFRVSVTTKF